MSDKKKKIIIDIEFNSRPATKAKSIQLSHTKEWIDYRMFIFNKFTLQSLKKQTNQNFLVLVRYDKKTTSLINNALCYFETLPPNILFISNNKYQSTIRKNILGYDYLYLVQLDCDDMYHKTFINQLHEYTPKKGTEVLINQNGYVYDSINNRLGYWYHKSPPFYTTINPVKDYLKGKRIAIGKYHALAIKYQHEIINKRNYTVLIHDKNTMNKFDSYRVKNVIWDTDEISRILEDFI